MQPGFEVLRDDDMKGSPKGEKMMDALVQASDPYETEITKKYTGRRKVLVLYGPGRPWRTEVINIHRNRGGHVACWDLGYWDRSKALRLSFNGYHPAPHQLDYMSEPRYPEPIHVLREDANPEGPILLVGLGEKACVLYGLQPLEWETRAFKDIRKRFPKREVHWRPKGRRVQLHHTTTISYGDTIEDALKGKSLVVCRHSNVAVDAAVAGVPVECSDGAAVALYGNTSTPSPEARALFLRKLEWWNWRFDEAPSCWKWLREVANKEAARQGEEG